MLNTSHQNCISLFYDVTCMFSNLKKKNCCCIIIIIITVTESAEKNFVGDFNSNKDAFIMFNWSFHPSPKKACFLKSKHPTWKFEKINK